MPYLNRDTEIKPFLSIGTSDTTEDTLLDLLSNQADSVLNDLLEVSTLNSHAVTGEYFNGNTSRIYVKDFPIISVDAIRIGSSQTVYTQTEAYKFPSKNLILTSGTLGGGLNTEQNQIDYTAGYTTLPQSIKHALLLIVSGMYNVRHSAGVSSYSLNGRSVSLRNPSEVKEFKDIVDSYRKGMVISC